LEQGIGAAALVQAAGIGAAQDRQASAAGAGAGIGAAQVQALVLEPVKASAAHPEY
jgi:hypothetical protein